MYEFKQDLYGNVSRHDACGHVEYLGKEQRSYAGQSVTSVINDYGINVGSIRNSLVPKYDVNGNIIVNFDSIFPKY